MVSDVVSYSPVELRNVNDGSTMSGTYVWEDAHFSVKFVDNNGAVGSMENASFLSTLSRNVLPKNKLYLFGHEFDHWEDESGNVYSDGGFLDGHNFVARSAVELKAVFVPVDTSVIIKDGEFEFDLAGGAEAVFPDIPGNTKYQIFEMTPSGWQLVDSVNSRDSVVVNGENVSVFRNHYDPESCQFVLSGSKRMIDARGEYYYPESNGYSFKLVRVFDSGFEDIEVVSNFENGSFQFSPVELNAVGIYEYNVVELLGDDPLVSYDDHVEHVVVRVVDDSSGCLTAIVEEDSDGLLFTNVVNNFGSICLTKHAVNVDGEDAWDDGIVFKFEVQFFDELDSAPRSVYADYLYNVACDNGWMYNRKTGIMTILLYKDEPSVVIDHIPFGLKYRVREIVN
jgi:pilin isopeptide linkage protein